MTGSTSGIGLGYARALAEQGANVTINGFGDVLPGVQGLELCRIIRNDPTIAPTPIVMLTAKGEEVDKVLGLEIGADDYMTKPFSPREARCQGQGNFEESRAPEARDCR